jgi:hypothetical protein
MNQKQNGKEPTSEPPKEGRDSESPYTESRIHQLGEHSASTKQTFVDNNEK